jgi:hypothetical protein
VGDDDEGGRLSLATHPPAFLQASAVPSSCFSISYRLSPVSLCQLANLRVNIDAEGTEPCSCVEKFEFGFGFETATLKSAQPGIWVFQDNGAWNGS